MKIVKVTYTVAAGFAARNQENIRGFMNELRTLGTPGLRYVSYLGADGKTFTHIGTFGNDEAQSTLLELPAFRAFQHERDEHLEAEPQIETVSLAGASYDLLP